MAYKLAFHPDALAEWRALDGSVRSPLKALLGKRLENPRVPGGALGGALAGCYKIKLRKQGVRLVYVVDEERGRLVVLAVGRREDAAAYRAASSRAGKQVVTAILGADAPVTAPEKPPARRSDRTKPRKTGRTRGSAKKGG